MTGDVPRQLIMWNLITLDGLFEGAKKWDLAFHEFVWGDELEQLSIEQLATADTLVFGRVTYEGMASYWRTAEGEVARAMNSIGKIVFSRTLDKADWSNTRLVKGKAEDELRTLKRRPGKNMLVFGSADLSASLTRAGLIDEYRLCVAPVLLGSGTPLFKSSPEQLKLRLVEVKPLRTGGVILRYLRGGS
jgi:dihydrofolate reductase